MAKQREQQCFKVKVEFAKDGDDESHPPILIAVSRNTDIKTADDAVNHIMAQDTTDEDGKPVTRIHHKDNLTGQFFSVVKAEKVSDMPFPISLAPKIRSIYDAPKQPGTTPATGG